MLKEKRQVNGMILLFTAGYMVSYITRINYGAVISEMVSDTGFSKAMLSMALTGSFITYGIGQIVSGVLSDSCSPKRLMLLGFVVTILMNAAIPLCASPWLMTLVWCINGFAQSFMWPPMVKLMMGLFSADDYRRAGVAVSCGAQIGSIVVYAVAPALILLSGWESVFFASAIAGCIIAVLWWKFAKDVSVKVIKPKNDSESSSMKEYFSILGIVMLAVIMQGCLRDGISTWMPSYISDVYNLGNAVSILTGVVLPVFGIVCIRIASAMYRNVFRGPVTCAAAFLGFCALFLLVLSFVSGKSAVMSVICAAGASGCLHGTNMMLVSMVPQFFQRSGKGGAISGIINACTYIGSALSAYGIAVISDSFGWSVTLRLWLVIAVLGTMLCLCGVKLWKKKMR